MRMPTLLTLIVLTVVFAGCQNQGNRASSQFDPHQSPCPSCSAATFPTAPKQVSIAPKQEPAYSNELKVNGAYHLVGKDEQTGSLTPSPDVSASALPSTIPHDAAPRQVFATPVKIAIGPKLKPSVMAGIVPPGQGKGCMTVVAPAPQVIAPELSAPHYESRELVLPAPPVKLIQPVPEPIAMPIIKLPPMPASIGVPVPEPNPLPVNIPIPNSGQSVNPMPSAPTPRPIISDDREQMPRTP